MSLDVNKIDAITYDSFTTLVDVQESTRSILSRYIEEPEDVATVWRFRAVEYRMLANFVDHYETYLETTKHALEYALLVNNKKLSERDISEIVSVFYDLPVFDDVRKSMERINDTGFDQYIVSNGTHDLLTNIASNADIDNIIKGIVSANDIKEYKPSVRFYEHVSDQVGNQLSAIAHVASPWYDIYGAMNVGMQTIWLNRQTNPWERFNGSPDEILHSLTEFADIITD